MRAKLYLTGLILSSGLIAGLQAKQIEVTPEDEETSIEGGVAKMLAFPPISIDKSKSKAVVLSMEARVRSGDVVGYYCSAMQIEVNCAPVEGPRLINKPLEAAYGTGGLSQSLYCSKAWTLVYSHDFVSPDRNETYRLQHGNTCRFEFDITDLVTDKKSNKILIRNVTNKYQLVIRNITIKYDGETKAAPD